MIKNYAQIVTSAVINPVTTQKTIENLAARMRRHPKNEVMQDAIADYFTKSLNEGMSPSVDPMRKLAMHRMNKLFKLLNP